MDRRGVIFVGFALVCLVLSPVTPPDHRWFPVALAGLYVLLAAASFLDARSRRHVHRSPVSAADHQASEGAPGR